VVHGTETERADLLVTPWMVHVCAKLSKNISLTIVSAENCKEETIVSAESL
jgi:hypothetical protein